MVQKRQRRKSIKFRGSKTHGYGAKKKHRGAGSRGGRGNAGSGKRADTHKPSLWKINVSGKDPKKKGFFSWTGSHDTTMNVGHLASTIDTLTREGKAQQAEGGVSIDLGVMGVTKLLGAGKVARKLHVTVTRAAPKAKEKIEAAGGTLTAEIVDKTAVIAARNERAQEFRKKNAKQPPQQSPTKKEAVEE